MATGRRLPALLILLFLLLGLTPEARAQWARFVDRTADRLSAAPEFGTEDEEEKDFAYGDVDNDGDIDLVIVRKEIGTSAGKRTNILLMNEDGVLVDRTAIYAVASTAAGDFGFLTPTNDRDVLLVDVDEDGWLDIVTAVTISPGDPKAIGHPRIYINLGRDEDDLWQGFEYRESLIPKLNTYLGLPGFNPRFCAVAAGDVTGDGRPDLYFSDYDTGQFGPPQLEGGDFNDKLLINHGGGRFADETSRLLGQIFIPGFNPEPFELSAFGAAAAIADVNGDGVSDIIKQTALQSPQYVGVAYNNPDAEGFFDTYDVVNQAAPYFFNVGDLNKDGRPDIVISDDGTDRFLLNQGPDASGRTVWIGHAFSYQHSGDTGFNSNSRIADLDNDGWNDVLIAGSDVDVPSCGLRTNIYRNLGGDRVGADVTLQEQDSGPECAGGGVDCTIVGIPEPELRGVFDIAVIDIDQDGWKDLVLGKCSGTQVWMNEPLAGVAFRYPAGLPLFVDPGTGQTITVDLVGIGDGVPEPATLRGFVSIDHGPFQETAVVDVGDHSYEVTLPAIPGCAGRMAFYFTAENTEGMPFVDPPGGAGAPYEAIATLGTVAVYEDDIEGDVSGWTILNDPSLVAGGWEKAEPNGTISGFGLPAAPDGDAQALTDKTFAFVTGNGEPGGPVGANDVDGGPTDLISPPVNLSGSDGTIHFSHWFYTGIYGPALSIWVTGDGMNWTLVDEVRETDGWEPKSFRVAEYIAPTSQVQVRFRTSDNPNNSIVEAGIDLFRVERFACNECAVVTDCDDGVYCNGPEECFHGGCTTALPPCSAEECDEVENVCPLTGSGSVPDGGPNPGQPLRIDRGNGGVLQMSWGASCNAGDSDYSIVEGVLGVFTSHGPAVCSTGGSTSFELAPSAGDRYYLVVPRSENAEGSYGLDGNGAERPAAGSPCLAQAIAACQP